MQPTLKVRHLGVVEYPAARQIQEEHRDRILRAEEGAALFLLQHPPTVTLGSVTDSSDLLVSEEQFGLQGVELFRTNRGGKATYHGPGQLVGYPVIDLGKLAGPFISTGAGRASHGETSERVSPTAGPSVHEYLRGLEECLIILLRRVGLVGVRHAGETGVWIQDRKIASIGVAVRRWVTTHGFALNVDMDLNAFRTIRPCGFDPSIMTCIQSEGGTVPPWIDLERTAASEFARLFGFKIVE